MMFQIVAKRINSAILFVGIFLLEFISCQGFNANPISCSQLVFNNGSQDQHNWTKYSYEANYDSCLIDRKKTLKIQLNRLSQVSQVAIGLEAIKPFRNKLLVAVIRDPGVKVECEFKDSEDGNFAYFNCKEAGAALGGVFGNTVEISLRWGSERLNLKSTALAASFIITIRDLLLIDDEVRCPAPGFYFTQTLSNNKRFYALGEKVAYACCTSVSCKEAGEQSQRECVIDGWSKSSPRCPYEIAISDWIQPTNKSLWKADIASDSQNQNFSFYQDYFVDQITVDIWFGNIKNPSNACNDSKMKIYTDSASSAIPNTAIASVHPVRNLFHIVTGSWCRITLTPSKDTKSLQSAHRTLHCTTCMIHLQIPKNVPSSNEIKFIFKGLPKTEYDRYKWMKSGCPPIDPYVGMPEKYAGEAAMNYIDLNGHLKENPCRGGYRLIEEPSDMIQCLPSDGEPLQWKGKPPKCRLITCKRPPSVDNAYWRYLNDSTFHEVQYTCHAPWKIEYGTGIASCNYDKNEWEGVPSCVRKDDGGERTQPPRRLPSTSVSSTTSTFSATDPTQETTTSSNDSTSTANFTTERSHSKSYLLLILLVAASVLVVIIIIVIAVLIHRKNRTESSLINPQESDSNENNPIYARVIKSKFAKQPDNTYKNLYDDPFVNNEEALYSDATAVVEKLPREPAQNSGEIEYCVLEFNEGQVSARMSTQPRLEAPRDTVYALIKKK